MFENQSSEAEVEAVIQIALKAVRICHVPDNFENTDNEVLCLNIRKKETEDSGLLRGLLFKQPGCSCL